jgi:hypothetical protein
MVFHTIRSGLVQLENRQQIVVHDHPGIAELGLSIPGPLACV